MKNIFKFLIFSVSIAVIATSCELFELDNFEGPDAQVYGKIVDVETGELIQQEMGTSGDAVKLIVLEHGYAIKDPQEWKVMTSGEYRNNLVFAGTYDVVLRNGNFVRPDTLKGFEVGPGSNELNFEVMPNIRIKEPNISRDGDFIVATFQLEYAHEIGKVNNIAVFGSRDRFPSNSHNISLVKEGLEAENLNFSRNNSTWAEANPDETPSEDLKLHDIVLNDHVFELRIDLIGRDGRNLRPGRRYFFRIGAEPTELGEGVPNRYNYSRVFEMDL